MRLSICWLVSGWAACSTPTGALPLEDSDEAADVAAPGDTADGGGASGDTASPPVDTHVVADAGDATGGTDDAGECPVTVLPYLSDGWVPDERDFMSGKSWSYDENVTVVDQEFVATEYPHWQIVLHDDEDRSFGIVALLGEHIPTFTAGERMRVVAEQDCPWWCELRLAVVDRHGVVRYYLHKASMGRQDVATERCLADVGCVTLEAGGACPYDGECGVRVHPEVHLRAIGGIAAGPARSGAVVAIDGVHTWLLGSAFRMTGWGCDDAPYTWVTSTVYGVPRPGPCDPAVQTIPRDNPGGANVYFACLTFTESPETATGSPTDIDPTLVCDGGPGAGCAAGEVRCVGALDRVSVYRPELSAAKWAQLCELSRQPYVRLVGAGPGD